MPLGYHVNGPALVSVGTGAVGALEALGFSEDGVDVQIREYREPVKTDVAGPALPADLQNMGKDAIITANLSAYDLAILVKVRKRDDATTEGMLPTLGRLVGTSGTTGDVFRLLIAGPTDENWNFPTATLRDAQQVKVGTKYSVWRCQFYAWAFLAATLTTPKDAVLFNHSAA